MTCAICGNGEVRTLVDFGPQALSNRYLIDQKDNEETFVFKLGQCSACANLQAENPIPAAQLKAPYDWVRYNEQEAHLDDTVHRILSLPGINNSATVAAVSYKDDTTLQRLKAVGVSATWRIDPGEDLQIVEPAAGLETVQARLTPELAGQIVK